MLFELAAFWKRIGEEGVELILQESIRVPKPPNDDGSLGTVVSVDTTVQEKNITYPTDDKLYKKIIKKCWLIADMEGIDLGQSYRQVMKRLGNEQCFKQTKQSAKVASKANRKVRIIAGRLVREIAQKLPLQRFGVHLNTLKLYQRLLSQEKGDSNKIYNVHSLSRLCSLA